MRIRRMIAWLPGVDADRPPTDFELLRTIWERHRDEYAEGVDSRQTKVFLPIDIPAIAAELGVDVNSVFGRLYFHLDPQYAEPEDAARNRPRKSFFTPRLGPDVEGETNCINFPFLEAVLAGLWQQRNRDRWTFWIAVVSLGIAIGSLLVSFFG